MKLSEAIEQGRMLAVAVFHDHERTAAELFIVDDGVVFLDVGWPEPMPSLPRAHRQVGEIRGEGPWRVGEWIIREVDPETDGDILREWARWESFREETNGTRERGARFASEFLDMEVRA